ncbi:MAG: DUF6056 family protein [Crocinitomicaceae bacterium]|nr:DUF6056 family protein [Crocinitomicaceae bacterium]
MNKAWSHIVENKIRYSYLGIALFSLLAILPFLVACLYIHPNADDWWFAAELKSKGRVDFLVDFYNGWSGRYFSNILLSIPKSNMIENPWMYRLLPILFISLTFYTIYRYLAFIIGNSLSKLRVIILSLFSLGIYVTTMPEMFSAFYWNCASFYILWNVFFLLLVLEIIKHLEGHNSKGQVIKLIFLTLLCNGMAEVFILSLFVIYGSKLLFDFIKTKKINYIFIVLFVVLCIGSYFNLMSPGSNNRMDMSESQNGFVFSSIRALWDLFILQIAPLIFSPISILLILIVGRYSSVFEKREKLQKLFEVSPLVLLILIIFSFFLHHAASIYGAGYTIQGRVLNITSIAFFLAILYLLLVLRSRKYFNLNVGSNTSVFIVLAIAFLMNFSQNSRIIGKDVLVDLPAHSARLDARYDNILTAVNEGKDSVKIDPLPYIPRSLSLGIYNDQKNFYNTEKCCIEMGHFFSIDIYMDEEDYFIPIDY